MALIRLNDLGLDLRLIFQQIGPFRLLAATFLFSASILHFLLTPLLEEKIATLKAHANTTQNSPDITNHRYLQQERFQIFLDKLPRLEERPRVLREIFEISASLGISLPQAEYQLQRNDQGEYYRLNISIPVNAPYPKLRGFLERVLLQIPSASIDEITVHRETVSNPIVNANLKFSVYFKDKN